jgi:hypothetical protein
MTQTQETLKASKWARKNLASHIDGDDNKSGGHH